MRQFNVLWWDFNKSHPEPYDVLSYFRQEYMRLKKKDRPVTKEQWTEFVKRKGHYRFWGDAVYETVMTTWPPSNKSHKLDVWQQIEMNFDLIVELLMEEYNETD